MAVKYVYAGLGSNLGVRAANLRTALRLLGEAGGVRVLRVSRETETKPLGDLDQPDYLNAVAELEVSLGPKELLDVFHRIEQQMGRARGGKWAPRTIDIDMLLCGDEIVREADLRVPHPHMHLRSFVLEGMMELAPGAVHPLLRETMEVLAARLNGRSFVPDASRPQLISVGGVIGVGKTTLAEHLAKELDCKLIREAYDTNPFLARVYGGEKGLALDSQIYFLTSRTEQLAKTALEAGKPFVSDYIFDQEHIYAARLLDTMQLGLYRGVNRCMAGQVCEPAVTVFLHDTAANCLERIKKRGRSYEQKMDVSFLEGLGRDYDEMFGGWSKSPLLRVDASVTDCRKSRDVRRLADQIRAYIMV
ncbi:MAG TPA: 2-amino-4-hydroxy-6-hydroxymethyldihydropteridine diphosphokinase [Sedimentisphaerales bacterium]|nr:2-amino-4-hydroxy-6-hydroxymethyldihydropteridine diphosphokinase [Sedimentisphaerales bacterium]